MASTSQDPSGGPWDRVAAGIMVACVLLGAAAGLLFFFLQAPVYRSEAAVLVLPTVGGLDSSVDTGRTGPIQIQTEAEVAHSVQVATRASAALDGAVSAQDLLRDSSVSTTQNSQVLAIQFDAATPELARDGAQALAEAYLDRRAAAARTALDDAAATLTEDKDIAKAELQSLTAKLSDGVSTEQRARINANIGLAVDKISDINSRLVALRVQTTEGGQVISAAYLPAGAISPVLWIDVAAGMVLGALAGTGLVLVRDRLRSRREQDARVAVPVASFVSGPAASNVRTDPTITEPVVRSTPRDATAAQMPRGEGPAEQASSSRSGRPPLRGTDPDSGLEVLAALRVEESGVVADTELAALSTFAVAIRARRDFAGPLLVVGVDYRPLITRAVYALADAWAGELGRSAVVFTDPGSVPVPGRPALSGPGLAEVVMGEQPTLATVTVLEPGARGALGPGAATIDLASATQSQRLTHVWEELAGGYGTVLAAVQTPFETALAQSVVQSAGSVVVVVSSGLGQQQDLAYAIEQLTWLGVADQLAGVISVFGPRLDHADDELEHAEPVGPVSESNVRPAVKSSPSSRLDEASKQRRLDQAVTKPATKAGGGA